MQVVVTVLCLVRSYTSSPVTSSQDSTSDKGSGSFQFSPARLTSFHTFRNMALTWNEKKIHKESKLSTKLHFFLPCIKKTWRNVPLRTSSPRHRYPLRNHTEYSTSHFVLLHLNCKTRGQGAEKNLPKSTPNMILCPSTRKPERTVDLHFFFVVASMTAR